MGDEAEGVFEEVSPLGKFERLGWNRPSVSMKAMSDFIKHMPDYYTSSGHVVEVMGCGTDGVLKLKLSKWEGLKQWNQYQPLMLFVWNSFEKKWALIQWPQLKSLVQRARSAGVEAFQNDGNEYFPIQWLWIEHDPINLIGWDRG